MDNIPISFDNLIIGQIVIVAYQPKSGKAADLKKLLGNHVQRLRQQNLATGRDPVIMEAGNGIIIEVFEWLSAQAIQQAHSNPVVQQMWQEFDQVCIYVPLNSVNETSNLFATFTAAN